MAIADPETIASMLIDGVDLGEVAPETWSGGTKVALKVWYYREGVDTVSQRGRVEPKPVTMSFKLVGPDALNNAMWLDRLTQTTTKPVPIVWGPISFDALLEDCDYSLQRTEVTVSLQLKPVTNPNPSDSIFFVDIDLSPVELLGEIADGLNDLFSAIDQVGKFFDNAFQELRDGLDAVDTAVAQTTAAIATVKKIADLPTAAAAAIKDTLVNASEQLQGGVVTVVAAANAQGQLPGEIAATVSSLAATCSIDSERLEYIAQIVTPISNPVVLRAGDTLTDIAEATGVSIGAILQANPDLARTPFTPGTTIEVPDADS